MSKKVMSDGTVWVDEQGHLHRDDDLPAFISDTGEMQWVQHGVFHRDGDKPALVKANGVQVWGKNGKIHRDTVDEHEVPMPAIISNMCKKWVRDGTFSHPGSEWVAMLPDGTKGYYVPEQNRLRFDNGEEHILDENGVGSAKVIPPSDDEPTKVVELQCVVCMENKKCIAFNCGHLCSCHACSRELDTCPMCRVKIKTKMRLFV